MSKPDDITGEPARMVRDAEHFLIRAADGVTAIKLLVEQYRGGGAGADAARNAVDWCAANLSADIESAAFALDQIHFDRTAVQS